ncbi:hypothetical protein AVEN_113052-1 [Araneus ventricosus]|uniref:Uncharacterized protein n=1 Tax=Araneus ventricosus TaxID=182803 RepID=A0A4Y2SF61_ARAVE|nr:hypothetical protein AVEN_113052-1 [Araneus ventricosus]
MVMRGKHLKSKSIKPREFSYNVVDRWRCTLNHSSDFEKAMSVICATLQLHHNQIQPGHFSAGYDSLWISCRTSMAAYNLQRHLPATFTTNSGNCEWISWLSD